MSTFFSNPLVVAVWLVVGIALALYNRKEKNKPVAVFDWVLLVALGPVGILLIGAGYVIDKLDKIRI